MSDSPHLSGQALKALVAGHGLQPYMPRGAVAVERQRDRIWELAPTLHCSIVGTCLTNAEGRQLLAKLGVHDARTMSEHRLHGEIVHLAGRRDAGGKLLQKALDRRHEPEIRRFAEAGTAAQVKALWRDSLERGEIPGAYWAAMTHPATDWTLVQEVFGEVHMLSHLVGQSNRADIRRLRRLEADLAERDETIARQDRRILDLGRQRDALSDGARAREAERVIQAATPRLREPEDDRAAIEALEMRLARERAHAQALDERIAVLMTASGRLGLDLEVEIARRKALEAEVAALEEACSRVSEHGEARDLGTEPLAGRTILYVGGRPRQVANLRRFTVERGGRLLSHDGGVDDNVSLLPGLVGQSDLVLFPVECVSHEASGLVKRHCQETGTAFRPVRSASLASFVHAVLPGPAGDGRACAH